MKKISFIFGTRPEAIKLCPLILEMKKKAGFETHICVTAQHREMLDQVLDVFNIIPEVDLSLMEKDQTLAGLTAKAVKKINDYLCEHKPDMVIVQGDTTTVFCAALAAFYNQIPVGHVEAGLRTGNKRSPFPEEINRDLTTRITDLHFAPTKISQNNLLNEGVDSKQIHITGNTVIDALNIAIDKVKKEPALIPDLPERLMDSATDIPIILITGHRRENHGQGFINICKAISALAEQFKETAFVYPVHLNPNVLEPVNRILSDIDNVFLINPLSYFPFVALMNKARLILTDSGGVQEEAPSLGKPVLVMRNTTERPEAVSAGTVKLIGTDSQSIIDNVTELMTDKKSYEKMANAVNPYGDGKACGRIINAIEHYFLIA